MKFRLKAFLLHISASASLLGTILGVLYWGWYRWPGWYVTGVLTVTAIMVSVDVTLGPLITFLIANPRKPRRELARDVGIIVTVQLIALVYGVTTLWIGRPLYYVFWVNELKPVAASQVPSKEIALAEERNPKLAPHWYSRPRWVWAPKPANVDPLTALTQLTPTPSTFKPLSEAGDELRARLRKVDQIARFTAPERQALKQQLLRYGLAPDTPDALFMVGGDKPVLAVFDLATLRVTALIRVK